MKKLLLLFITVLTTSFMDAQSITFVDGDYTFTTIDDSDFCEIVAGTTATGDVTLPTEAFAPDDEVPYIVTGIADAAFQDVAGITSMVIPAGILSIGSGALRNMTDCTSITLPEGLTTVGKKTFYLTPITWMDLPSTITSWGTENFSGCSQLTGITFGGVTTINNRMFRKPTSIAQLLVPATVTTFEENSWNGCDITVLVMAGSTPPTIDAGWAGTAANITAYVPAADIATYEAAAIWSEMTILAKRDVGETFTVGDYDYRITSFGGSNEVEVTGSALEALDVPSTVDDGGYTFAVTAIGNAAFKNNAVITSVVLPESVIELKQDAFIGAASLTSINLENVQIFNKNCLRLTGLIALGDLSSAVVIGDNGLARVNVTDVELNLPAIETWDRYGMVKANGAQNNIQVIKFGPSLKNVGSGLEFAFYGLNALTALQFASETPVTIDVALLFATGGGGTLPADITLYVPVGATQAYIDAGWVGFANIVEGVLGTNEVEQALGLSLYPNPTHGIVNINSKNLSKINVTVYDINGRTLLNTTDSRVDISRFAAGLYIFRIKTDAGELVKRILKN